VNRRTASIPRAVRLIGVNLCASVVALLVPLLGAASVDEVWHGLGGSDVGQGVSQASGDLCLDPRIAFDAGGNPLVGWIQSSNLTDLSGSIRLKHWTGNTWEDGPSPAAQSGNPGCDSMRMACDAHNRLVITWVTLSSETGNHLHVSRWEGGHWATLGEPVSVEGAPWRIVPRLLNMLLDSHDEPWLTWNEQSGPGSALDTTSDGARLIHWDGTRWREFTSIRERVPLNAAYVPLSLDSLDHPVVAWQASLDTPIETARWTGTEWESLGSILAPPDTEFHRAGGLVVASPEMYLVWNQIRPMGPDHPHSTLHVLRRAGQIWEELGDPAQGISTGPSAGVPLHPAVGQFTGVSFGSMSLLPNETPVIAWAQGQWIDIGHVYVQRWNGQTWVDLGDGSGQGTGITPHMDNCRRPHLAVAPTGRVAVVWATEPRPGGNNVYLRVADPPLP
jgi:hypothetical protein